VQVRILALEVWGGVSARAASIGEPPAADKGLTRLTEGLAFTRWDAAAPADVDNLVLLSGDEVRSCICFSTGV